MRKSVCLALAASSALVAVLCVRPALAATQEENWNSCLQNKADTPDEMIRTCRLVLSQMAMEPNVRADAYNNIGVAYEKLGDYDRAVNYFDQALRAIREYMSIPEFRQLANYTRRNRSLIYIKTEQYGLALKDIKAMVTNEPTAENFAWSCRARAQWDTDFSDVIDDCNHALEKTPDIFDAHFGRIMLEYRNGAFADAVAECAEITKKSDAAYLCSLAEQRKAGKPDRDRDIAAGLVGGRDMVDGYKKLGIVP
jgi:tetratricopeptide (TPR) repeat protein